MTRWLAVAGYHAQIRQKITGAQTQSSAFNKTKRPEFSAHRRTQTRQPTALHPTNIAVTKDEAYFAVRARKSPHPSEVSNASLTFELRRWPPSF